MEYRDGLERRFTVGGAGAVTLRETKRGSIITGLASVFYDPHDEGTQYTLYPGLVERIAPTAFDSALRRGDDTVALINHNSDLPLGRVGTGTLRLFKERSGLRYEITPTDQDGHFAQQYLESIRRGDFGTSSFAFTVADQDFYTDGDLDVRVIRDLTYLYDVSPTVYGAYKSTTTGVRAARPPVRDPKLARKLAGYAARARAIQLQCLT